MFDELEIIEKIGNALQGQEGLLGQIGWGLLAFLGVVKIFQAISAGKMDWGEAGKKLEEMFKQFQWRLEGGENKGGDAIKAVDHEGNTIYSYSSGKFRLVSKGKNTDITRYVSRRAAKKLAKLRKSVVENLLKQHKEDSLAALTIEMEKFLVPEPIVKVGKFVTRTVVNSNPTPAPTPKPVVNMAEKVNVVHGKVELVKPVPVANPEPKKVVVACPNCRANRAFVVEGNRIYCPECRIGNDKVAPQLVPTTADPQEFIGQNTNWSSSVKSGMIFKNYKSTNGKFLAQHWSAPKLSGFEEVSKQPSETFRDKALVAAYKELKNKIKEVEKASKEKEVAKIVVDASKLFSAANAFVKEKNQPVAKVEEKPKAEEVKPKVEEVKKSEYELYCCPKCRITRAIVKIGQESNLTCKNDDCNGEKLVKTTGNPEEFVLENGMKVTDYLKSKNLTSVRFRNYGTKKDDKFVAVILPMKNAPVFNGEKMIVKKQPSATIVGYIKPEKKPAEAPAPKPVEKTVDLNSSVKVEYASGPHKIKSYWALKDMSAAWRNVREMMKGMKVGEKRIIPACKEENGSYNEQFEVTVLEIA